MQQAQATCPRVQGTHGGDISVPWQPGLQLLAPRGEGATAVPSVGARHCHPLGAAQTTCVPGGAVVQLPSL